MTVHLDALAGDDEHGNPRAVLTVVEDLPRLELRGIEGELGGAERASVNGRDIEAQDGRRTGEFAIGDENVLVVLREVAPRGVAQAGESDMVEQLAIERINSAALWASTRYEQTNLPLARMADSMRVLSAGGTMVCHCGGIGVLEVDGDDFPARRFVVGEDDRARNRDSR